MIKRTVTLIFCLFIVFTSVGFAETTTIPNFEAPKNFTAELKEEAGFPYFQFNSQVPSSVQALYDQANEQGHDMFYEVEYKVGNGEWEPAGGVHFTEGPAFTMYPDDMGLNDGIDIKANTYHFRLQYMYNAFEENDEGNMIANPIFSPYSNVVTIGLKSYYKDASKWAEPELNKAAEYGFITDKIKDKMNGPITREELSEVIMKIYEKIIGEAKYTNLTEFTDTQNPEVYKAFELGIVNGMGNNKFAPKNLTNREQVAAMMYRAVKAIKPDADFSIVGTESFKDEKLISPWALESVKFMNKQGLINGNNGFVDPKGTTTREQAVLIVLRTYEKYNK